jgi:hypothetical protein
MGQMRMVRKGGENDWGMERGRKKGGWRRELKEGVRREWEGKGENRDAWEREGGKED